MMCLVVDQGQLLIFVDGLGWVWDCWVIIGVEECKSLFVLDGVLCKIEFIVMLLVYGMDCV